MKILNKQDLQQLLPYSELIQALKTGFRSAAEVPLRHAHNVGDNSLLLMPSWQKDGMLGLKMTMVCPKNNEKNLETVQSTYILSDAVSGVPLAVLDGDELTSRRTACASALASSYLSNENASSLLMMGCGNLAPHLIHAHSAVRDLKDIYLWARRPEQAENLVKTLKEELDANIVAVNDPEKYANICDIISCATFANDPILKGKWLKSNGGQHIDLVGGYTYEMREADNDVIKSADLYVDTFDGALSEAGDLLRPIDQGVISKDDVKADFYDMVKVDFQKPSGHNNTLFKSVGTAIEDLIAAKLAYEKLTT